MEFDVANGRIREELGITFEQDFWGTLKKALARQGRLPQPARGPRRGLTAPPPGSTWTGAATSGILPSCCRGPPRRRRSISSAIRCWPGSIPRPISAASHCSSRPARSPGRSPAGGSNWRSHRAALGPARDRVAVHRRRGGCRIARLARRGGLLVVAGAARCRADGPLLGLCVFLTGYHLDGPALSDAPRPLPPVVDLAGGADGNRGAGAGGAGVRGARCAFAR